MFSAHLLWEHSIFATPAYQTFAVKVLVTHAKTEMSVNLQLCAVMSVMKDKILIMQQIVEKKTDYWDHHNSVKLNIVKGQLQNIIEGWMK